MASNVNADSRLADAMITLKRHLRSCRQCQAAIKAHDPLFMCDPGVFQVLRAAERYDGLISLRTKAFKDKQGTVIACPDPSAHGLSYSLTALPRHVNGIQDRLL